MSQRKKSTLSALTVAVSGLLIAPALWACTSLLYSDAHDNAYAGRTLELPMELPYKVSYFPQGTTYGSQADKHHVLDFTGQNAFVSIGVPDPVSGDVKVIEGLNDKGLTFSLLAFPSAEGPTDMVDNTQAVLAAIDLGAWTLSQFDTVSAVKSALSEQPTMVTSLLPGHLLSTPFHYVIHDASGASAVIEFFNGEKNIIDNPLGVMTNGPEFSWHMTNMNNYTHLSNIDHSRLDAQGVRLEQPDSGIATAALPSSNTSVGRFVRAFYYANFAEKAETPERAITTLSQIMNNFDRPRGITIDNRFKDGIANITAPGVHDNRVYTSEYTSWVTLTDLAQRKLYVRTYDSLNYMSIDLTELTDVEEVKHVSLSDLHSGMHNATAALAN